MPKRIIATFTGDHTGFKRDFDCTEAVLALTKEKLKQISDFDYQSDNLAPESLIEESREVFQEMWGDGFKNVEFGFGINVEESICNYFGVTSLQNL